MDNIYQNRYIWEKGKFLKLMITKQLKSLICAYNTVHDDVENGNHISTVDYGLYGANAKTGASVKFDSQQKTVNYNDVVADLFKNNKTQNY